MDRQIRLYDESHGHGQFRSDWNRTTTLLKSMYDVSTLEALQAPKYFTLHERMYIHTFVYEMSAHGSGGSEWLYVRLIGMVAKFLTELERISPCTDLQFLEFVYQAERHVQDTAKRIHNALKFFNRNWVQREIKYGERKVVDVLELHRTLLSTTFLANVQGKVRTSAIKLLYKGVAHDCPTLQRSVIQDLIRSRRRVSQTFLPKFSFRRRPIYLLSRKLEQLVSMSLQTEACSRASDSLPCPTEVSQPQMRESSVFTTCMATFDHWGLLIGPFEKGEWELFPGANRDSYSKTPASGLLCELQALDEDDGYISAFVGAPEGRSFDNRSLCLLKGYTSDSDDEIRYYAKQAVSSMQRKYDPIKNNCQKFCHILLMCINIPTTVEELQSDYMKLPFFIQEDVMLKRHARLLPKIYQQTYEGKALTFPEVDEDKILPVESLAINTKGLLIIITAVFFWAEIHIRLYFLIRLCKLTIDLLGSRGARDLIKLGHVEKRKQKPYTEYKTEFDENFEKTVMQFFQELDGE